MQACLETIKLNGFDTIGDFFIEYLTIQHCQSSARLFCRERKALPVLDRLWSIAEAHERDFLRDWVIGRAKSIADDELANLDDDKIVSVDVLNCTNADLQSLNLSSIMTTTITKCPRLHNLLSHCCKSNDFQPSLVLLQLKAWRNRKFNRFQTLVGLWAYASGLPKRVYTVLNAAALSISHMQTTRHLRELSTSRLLAVRQLVKDTDPGTINFMVCYDNCQFPATAGDQSAANRDNYVKVTSGSVWELDRVYKVTSTDIRRMEGTKLSAGDLVRPGSHEHWTQVRLSQLAGVLNQVAADDLRPIKAAFRLISDRSTEYTIDAINALPLRRSKRHALPTTQIDEGTLDGNIDYLDFVYDKMLQLEPAYFDNRMCIHGGDLGTVNLLLGAQKLRSHAASAYDGLRFLVLVPHLFHARMAALRMIFSAHWPSLQELAVKVLKHKRVSKDVKNFHDFLDDISTAIEDVSKQLIPANIAEEEQTSRRSVLMLVSDLCAFEEHHAAKRDGDIGRVLDVLDHWTVQFQASSTTMHYGRALIRVQAGLKHEWSAELREMVIGNWLVNPSGREGHWREVDHVQEEHNRMEKVQYSSRAFPKPDFIEQAVSANIPAFAPIQRAVEGFFSASKPPTAHSAVSLKADVLLAARHVMDCFSESANVVEPMNLTAQGWERVHDAIQVHKRLRQAHQGDTPFLETNDDELYDDQELAPIWTRDEDGEEGQEEGHGD
ncbi:unnamed protein product [Tilletia controversa]|nr:unnamed protein product [Tilletia controversa]